MDLDKSNVRSTLPMTTIRVHLFIGMYVILLLLLPYGSPCLVHIRTDIETNLQF